MTDKASVVSPCSKTEFDQTIADLTRTLGEIKQSHADVQKAFHAGMAALELAQCKLDLLIDQKKEKEKQTGPKSVTAGPVCAASAALPVDYNPVEHAAAVQRHLHLRNIPSTVIEKNDKLAIRIPAKYRNRVDLLDPTYNLELVFEDDPN